MIPLSKLYHTGFEQKYIEEALRSGKTSGNGPFSQRCCRFFEERYGFKKALLTTSCTDALEMCALLADIKPGDEVIIPSYTFVSTALPFIRAGAHIVFGDSYKNNPNLDAVQLEKLITKNTKAIVAVHYAGISCDMEVIMELAEKYRLLVIEDAAQAVDSWFTDSKGRRRALGSIGHLGALSFHDTKNITSGEGGLLTVNDERFLKRSEIIWEKGTNRAAFFRGEVDKYGWVDLGSSFLASEITAAYLWGQLQEIDQIQEKRRMLWDTYDTEFRKLQNLQVLLPDVPRYAEQNGHLFYVVTRDAEHCKRITQNLKEKGYQTVFHYLSLHKSSFYSPHYRGRALPNSERLTDCLLRLPLYYELSPETVKAIVNSGCFE